MVEVDVEQNSALDAAVRNDVQQILVHFKAESVNMEAYEDQTVDCADVRAVNQCIPYIVRDLLLESGDSLHELKPMHSVMPFYAWFRGSSMKSVGIETALNREAGTTAIKFKLVEAYTLEELLNALVMPLFTGRGCGECIGE